ncbi:MAG: hypothetical protein HY566_00125 [Candidatus Kerfeldbacteria bacterium]|nr:hypothetical protein [Candidatus Kerfeldbacteria bacterium]
MGGRVHFLYKVGDTVVFHFRPQIRGAKGVPKIALTGKVTARKKSRLGTPVYDIRVGGRHQLMLMQCDPKTLAAGFTMVQGMIQDEIIRVDRTNA